MSRTLTESQAQLATSLTKEDIERQLLIKKREKAIESIKQWRKRMIGPTMTLEEIISARDEGRKY